MAEILFNLDKVTVSLTGKLIFSGLSWEVQNQQRVGLVGPNGTGKSTLLKLVARELAPDEGNIFRKSGLTWGRLEQEPDLPPGKTTLEEAMTAVPDIAAIHHQLAELEQQMGTPEVYEDGGRLAKVVNQHEKWLHQLEQLDGASYESRVKETLVQLGFGQDRWGTQTEHLSGGQKKLVMLARLLVQAPDLLLLDEPDNHLDLEAKQRLEKVIRGYSGCVVIISHDRYLLDEVATHIAELENGRLTLYPGNYTSYTTARELARLRQAQLYAAQQKEIARIEAAIARFELWASLVVNERHIKQARSRQKMLDKMDKVEKVFEQRRMTLDLAGWRGSNKVLELENVTRRFENGRTIFNRLNQILWHGERVGLVGPNGAGKSFLLKQLLDPENIHGGQIKIGPSVKIGYYAQEHETLDYSRDLITEIRQSAPVSREVAVAFLHRFLYTYDQMQQPIGKLSGGERSRLQLAKLVLERPNLLLLDEPTNNLDIASIEVLEQTLEEFDGTLLIVSHDRYFLDQVVDRVLELRDGNFTEFDGGYTDYLAAGGRM
ncbi:MAG: ABC-F family ATP-binding cassette domain-containing protein [Anaerolineaceae bacterium]|nr:ABC-F family ATP-binding cassette domain-containing protein [Anaerolineaceae bacterium]